MHRNPGKTVLRKLLSERNQYPEQAPRIDSKIRELFERKVAILVLDMSGFSRLAAKHGIIHYLAMIEQMDGAARPAVIGNRGLVVKQEADNLFAVFDTPVDALESALDILRAFDAVNTVVSEDRHVHGCIGIGFGETLVIDNMDLFGNEMNLASRLGEDLAKKSDILITELAANSLPKDRYALNPVESETNGSKIRAFKFKAKLDE